VHTLMGTPEYMSPEAWSGESEKIDSLSDIWAVSVVLFELLSGSLPFEAPVDASGQQMGRMHIIHSVLYQITAAKSCREVMVDLGIRNPVSEAIAAVIAHGLQKDKTSRTATAREMITELQHAVVAADRSAPLARQSSSSRSLDAAGDDLRNDHTVQWEFQTDAGSFEAYSAHVSQQLEAAHGSKVAVQFTVRRFDYLVDWSTLEQVNGRSLTRRKIRRRELGREDEPESETIRLTDQLLACLGPLGALNRP
jgi:serine/threonine protein kinase